MCFFGDSLCSLGFHLCRLTQYGSSCTWFILWVPAKQSKTLMFVNMSPVAGNADESFCSLNFAARVRTVELGKASKNVSSGRGSGSGAGSRSRSTRRHK